MQALLRPDGLLLGGQRFRAAFGRGGVRTDKREGDGATPAGELRLLRVLYRADRGPRPRCAVPAEPIAPDDGWCDDPSDPLYNRPIRLPCAARHEALWRTDEVYDVIGVLDWNTNPVMRDRGSAIFLHVARPGYDPTEGCIALALPDLRAALAAGLTGLRVESA